MATSACVGAMRLLVQRQRALQQRLGSAVVAHLLIKLREVIGRLSRLGRVGPEHSLPNRQRARHQRLGGLVVALAVVEDRQGIAIFGDVRGRRGPTAFSRIAIARPSELTAARGLSRAALRVRKDDQGIGHVRMGSAVRAFSGRDQLLRPGEWRP